MSDSTQRILGTVLSNLPGFLALKNADLAYEVVNPKFCQFIGKSPDAIIGKTDKDLFPADEAEVCLSEGKSVLSGGVSRKVEQQLTGSDGPHIFESTRAPIMDENGDPAGVMFTAYDITAVKQREQVAQEADGRIAAAEQKAAEAEGQLAEATQRAEAAEQAKATLEQQATAAEQKAADAEQQFAQVQQQLAESQQQLKIASEELEQFKGGMAQELEESKARVAELEAQVEKARTAALQVEQEMTRRVEEATAARDEAAASAQQLEQAKAAAKQLAQQLVDTLQ